MNEKQQQLTFDKGITNVPSDALCSDNALEESIGMIYDDGEHRVIQKPETFINTGLYDGSTSAAPTLLYIHRYNIQERYIGYRNNTIIWGEKNNATFVQKGSLGLTYASGTKVTSIGKTLIIADANGMHYFLWNESRYKSLGDVPAIDIEFTLESKASHVGNLDFAYNAIRNTANTEGVIGYSQGTAYIRNQEAFNNLVVGVYAKNKKAIAHKKGFCLPFFIRAALEMFDGSYYHIGQPILMFPSVTESSFNILGMGVDERDSLTMFTGYAELYTTLKTSNLSDWSDVVKDVVLFVTDGIEIYDTNTDQKLETTSGEIYNGVFTANMSTSTRSTYNSYTTSSISGLILQTYKTLLKKSEDDLIKGIKGESVFYKLCSIGLEPKNNLPIAEKIETHVLENLVTQEVLEYDDYYSNCKLYPEFLYSYNSRLNIANVSRGFFSGYGFFMPWDNLGESTYNIYVTIKTETGNVVVKKQVRTIQKMGYYFYYPDSRATNVVIKMDVGGNTILDAKLDEHPGLNGAYYFAGLPAATAPTRDVSGGGSSSETSPTPKEVLPNYIIQSEANNPWVFLAQGYFKVGTGSILSISSITQALSEGQFGQYPLLVFSTDGIWALSVASTGYYNSIHPMSREVCNNSKSITQTDGAVFFTSEKGLMVVVGNQVKCVSEQLSGRETNFSGEISMGNFHDYLLNAIIAYDYRDSLLWIFNGQRLSNNSYCYVYSIKSGTFGKYDFRTVSQDYVIVNVVNYYPDYLIQDNAGNVRSLLERKNINNDTDTYSGLMITRPMKLENGLALKSLMQIMHIKQIQGSMTLRIFASNNFNNWVELHSLRGTPWKYYRFRYDFTNLKATDRFSGTMLITQERRTDKLR